MPRYRRPLRSMGHPDEARPKPVNGGMATAWTRGPNGSKCPTCNADFRHLPRGVAFRRRNGRWWTDPDRRRMIKRIRVSEARWSIEEADEWQQRTMGITHVATCADSFHDLTPRPGKVAPESGHAGWGKMTAERAAEVEARVAEKRARSRRRQGKDRR